MVVPLMGSKYALIAIILGWHCYKSISQVSIDDKIPSRVITPSVSHEVHWSASSRHAGPSSLLSGGQRRRPVLPWIPEYHWRLAKQIQPLSLFTAINSKRNPETSCWLVVWNIFPYIGNHHPNWRTPSFFRVALAHQAGWSSRWLSRP